MECKRIFFDKFERKKRSQQKSTNKKDLDEKQVLNSSGLLYFKDKYSYY